MISLLPSRSVMTLFAKAVVLLTVSSALMTYGSPLSAPADVKVFSPNRKFFAISTVHDQRTMIFSAKDSKHALWQIPVYTQSPHLADDGRQIAIGYPGGNILDVHVKGTDALITLFNASGVRRVLTVEQVVGNPARLRQTTDGRPWGRILDFNAKGQLVLSLDTVYGHQRIITITPPSE